MNGLNIIMYNKVFFSIICPTFNSEKYIEKNIISILNQTYLNFEIIYSDDGSLDKTLEIIEKYKKNFQKKKIDIRIIKNEHNGPGATRNSGIKISNYEWIAFIDSDDEWELNKLEKVANIIGNSEKYNCIAHKEFFKRIDGSVIKLNYKKHFKINKSIYNQLFIKNFLSTSSVTIQKKLIINANYFDERLANAQDYDLWLKIGDNLKLYFLSEYLGSYNERNDNITSIPYTKKIKNLLKILKKNKSNVNKLFYYYKFFRLMINREWFK